MFTKKEIDLAEKTVEAIKQIAEKQGKEWEWMPVIGEQCLFESKPSLITDALPDYVYLNSGNNWISKKDVIPLLHWEKIEEILEGMGYWLRIGDKYSCQIHPPNGVNAWPDGAGIGKSRQEAVQRAVIKLGEEAS